MTREQKILSKVDKNRIGIEIGPSHRPAAPKKDGFNVHIIDHMDKWQLREKYKAHNVEIDNIEDVDFIWNGESYADLVGRKKYYNWIIASHVIEHTPDLISFINQCDEVLHEDGVLSLAIPDARYCFDYFRPLTGIAKVIDAHHARHTIHTPGTAAEYFLNFSKKGGGISWYEGFKGETTLEFSMVDAYNQMQTVLNQGAYLDLHSWCFTPTSFRLLIQDLNNLQFISLKEVDFYPSEGCEFFITLGRKGQGFTQNRIDALKTIKAEISL